MRKINFRFILNALLTGLASTLLVACSGGGGGDTYVTPAPAPVLTGVFTDAVVSGVSYSTATRNGLTDDKGQFNYVDGETVTFTIGNIQLGSALAGAVITPLSLVGTTDSTNRQVINIVRLLMTLDLDGNPDNGIQITTNTRAAAAGVSINFDVPVAEFTTDATVLALVAAAETSNTALVDGTTAENHFNNTLASTWGLMEWGVGHWSAN